MAVNPKTGGSVTPHRDVRLLLSFAKSCSTKDVMFVVDIIITYAEAIVITTANISMATCSKLRRPAFNKQL